jgi:uncharacterized tellurite resistance protein B-like protein
MLRRAFESLFRPEQADNVGLSHELAAAALLLQVLSTTFSLAPEELAALSEDATHQVEQAVSLHDFTRVINQAYTPEEKSGLVGLMWQIAIADGEISKYEDHLIRRVADLIYVPHHEFIRLKHQAMEQQPSPQT